MFMDLVDDGASYPCSFIFLGYGEMWRCPAKATTALTEEAYKTIQLPQLVKLAGRAVCQIHQGTLSA